MKTKNDVIDVTERPLTAAERYERGLLSGQRPVNVGAVDVLGPAAPANVRPGAHLDFTADDESVATALSISLDGSMDMLVSRAVASINQAALRAVEAGYLLLKVKSTVEHGQFEGLIESAGLTRYRAAEMMRMAKVLTLAPEAQRAAMLEMPKKKVLALASADQAVLEALMEDGADKIDMLSVRELKAEIRSMKKALADTQVQRDTAEAQAEALRKRLDRPHAREDHVPLVVAELRAEIVAQHRKAELSIESFQGLGSELGLLIGTEAASEWVDGTARLALASLASLRLLLDGQIARFMTLLPEGEQVLEAIPSTGYLSQQEVVEAAQLYQRLTAVHEHETALRKWEREQDRPRSKGRPTAKPEAPKFSK